MEIEGFYRTILKKIDDEIASIDDAISSGRGITDFTGYKAQVEKRRGVLAIRNEIVSIYGGIFKREPIKPPGEQ